MGSREPSVLGGDAGGAISAEIGPATPAATERPQTAPPRASTRDPARQTVVVAGFWRRALAAGIDAAVVLPAAMLLTWIAGKLAGVALPATRNAAIDYWLDLALAGEPSLWGGFGLFTAIVVIYLLVFQVTLAQTLGMRVMKLHIIDVYGERPSLWRAAARTAGYLASALTLGLGFIWIGFDREKRALHDYLAGTYVVRGAGARPGGGGT
jgi:uncharacterized RDD family membrane protein YckC